MRCFFRVTEQEGWIEGQIQNIDGADVYISARKDGTVTHSILLHRPEWMIYTNHVAITGYKHVKDNEYLLFGVDMAFHKQYIKGT